MGKTKKQEKHCRNHTWDSVVTRQCERFFPTLCQGEKKRAHVKCTHLGSGKDTAVIRGPIAAFSERTVVQYF
jgi:hypothetical protein